MRDVQPVSRQTDTYCECLTTGSSIALGAMPTILNNVVTRRRLFFCVLIALILPGCKGSKAQTSLFITAGSIVRAPLERAITAYEKSTGVNVYANYGGSMQMLASAHLSKKSDVYISSAEKFMDKGLELGVVDQAGRVVIGKIYPVICVSKDKQPKIKALTDFTDGSLRLGIADPETVAIGLYAKLVLDTASLKVEPALIAHSHESLAAALMAGAVDAIIGWNVFPAMNPDNIESIPIDASLYGTPSIIEAAPTTFSRNKNAASDFVDFLAHREGSEIFKSHGYSPDG